MSQVPVAKHSKNPNPLINILVNIVFPAIILNKFSGPDRLGPYLSMGVALSLPLLFGAWEFYTNRHHNLVSVLGFVSILLTGGLGMLQVDGVWFAAKEALIPGIIAIATLVSLKTKKPFIKLILYNDKVINLVSVESALEKNGTKLGFERLMFQTTLVLAGSFVLSAILNFWLAIWLLKSPAGTPEFNAELGKMTALSYPVIVVPSLLIMMIAVWMLVRGLKALTGLEMHDILSEQAKK
ncbi:MAG: MFS transporter [Proteobacteria bacterium]|nr:MFS transporter [Pseudomonadota bacterium]